jgi:nitrate/TMAO reductase-like tetraheme cytochrome c subunit
MPLPPPPNDEPPMPDQAPEAGPSAQAGPKGLRGRLARLPRPKLDNPRAVALALILAGVTACALTLGAVRAVHWSESTEFCTTCHTMIPEEKANVAGAHSTVACGECHVAPGVVGFVTAKWGGTKELYSLVTDTYPRPIHADRARLPDVEGTCMECHSEKSLTESGDPMQLILRPAFKNDVSNTEETVALALQANSQKRATTKDSTSVGGVHWHLEQDISYVLTEDSDREIDLVEWKGPDGEVHQYIGTPELGLASDVAPDIARLSKDATWQTMDCIDCHNRVGHETPNAGAAVDAAIADGEIDQGLPYIRRDSVALLSRDYESTEQANAAFDAYAEEFNTKYPLEDAKQQHALDDSIDALKVEYALIATPAMGVSSTTYANNLGHQSSPGCFRCHDGAHFEVVKGKTTDRTISTACSTCHTFPQSGPVVSELPVGEEPATHGDTLWVFNHKNEVSSSNPANTTCASCHTSNYCENCHRTGATKVSHDEMMYDHAASIRKAGIQSCAACHQPYMCSTCHATPVLTKKVDRNENPEVIAVGPREVEQAARAGPRYRLSPRG